MDVVLLNVLGRRGDTFEAALPPFKGLCCLERRPGPGPPPLKADHILPHTAAPNNSTSLALPEPDSLPPRLGPPPAVMKAPHSAASLLLLLLLAGAAAVGAQAQLQLGGRRAGWPWLGGGGGVAAAATAGVSCPPQGFDSLQSFSIQQFIALPWFVQKQVS